MPSFIMKLILARHGETVGNVMMINQGQMHGELTSQGRMQAILLGKRLSAESIGAIYVSDLRRCVQTAEHVIVHHPDVPVYYEPLLRERHLGFLEGTKWGEVIRHTNLSGEEILNYRPEGGESINDVKYRVSQFLTNISQRHDNQTVLVVSHGQYIANIVLHVMGLDDTHYDEHKPENTAVSIIALTNPPNLFMSNCTAHLENNK